MDVRSYLWMVHSEIFRNLLVVIHIRLYSHLCYLDFMLSGVPSVNAYVSIHFLNIMAVFGFYYFFKKWVPPRWRRAPLIASALFALGSGFGWIYLFDMTLTDGVPTSVSSAFDLLHTAGQGTSDIRLATNFIISSHPDVTTGIQIMSLPAGFALLGLIKEATDRWKYIPVFQRFAH